MRINKMVAAIAIGFFMAATNAHSAEVNLRFEHFLPANSNAQKNVIEPWCEDLNEESDGRIECDIYPSMQLGGEPSQLVDMVRNNVIDIAWTALGYSPGRFRRSEALELPFILPAGGETASRIVWEYSQQYAQDDFEDYKVLAVYSDGGGAIHTTSKAVHDLDDLNGLRLRASTRMASKLLDSLGATPVSMPPSQIANTLSKGVIDGALAVWEVVPPTKLDETTFYHTEVSSYDPGSEPERATSTVTTLAVLMNKGKYQNMPEDLQKILDKYSGEALSVRFGKAWDDKIQEYRDNIGSQSDQEIIRIDDEVYKNMLDASDKVTEEWLNSSKGNFDRQEMLDHLKSTVDDYAPGIKN